MSCAYHLGVTSYSRAGYSRAERTALCDLLDDLGPAAPTLCAGWTTRDLATHLFIRERRPLAAPGILLAPLSALVEHSMSAAQQRYDYATLVAAVRGGPPIWSALRYADEQLNLLEYFVHHEDVRRARSGWERREIASGQQDALWARLRAMLRLKASKGPAGIRIQRADSGDMLRVAAGQPAITMVGTPDELVLYAFGRAAVARVGKRAGPDAVPA